MRNLQKMQKLTLNNEDLLNWLREVDKRLKRSIVLIALGGTALTLLGFKEFTRDVDFCIDSKDYSYFNDIIKDSKWKIDLFQDGYIFSEQLPSDYVDRAITINTNFNKIDIRALSFVDIIITKVARFLERDEEDISSIFRRVEIDKKELESRFEQIVGTFAGREEDFRYHFNLVIKRYFNVR